MAERYVLPLHHLEKGGAIRDTLRIRGMDNTEKLDRLHGIVDRAVKEAGEDGLHSDNFSKVFDEMKKDPKWVTGFYTGEKGTIERSLKEHLHIKEKKKS